MEVSGYSWHLVTAFHAGGGSVILGDTLYHPTPFILVVFGFARTDPVLTFKVMLWSFSAIS
jgi:hypothetical protein